MEEEKKDNIPLVIARKLASIQEITSITPINSDLELVKVLGWQIVVRKGDFKPKDLIIYFEIDTQLPEWYSEHEMTDYRSKTSIIAGILSQGIIKPLNSFKDNDKFKLGDDLSEVLEVKKYDDDNKLQTVKENKEFPIYLAPKTDEPRIQSEPRYLEYFKGKPYVATLKYDGTSGTFLLDPEKKQNLWVCSRNKLLDKGVKGSGVYFEIAQRYKIAEKLLKLPNYAIQGEVYGVGIQNNPLKIKTKQFSVFTVVNLVENRCLDYDEMVDFCKELDLPYVIAIERGDSFQYSIEELLEKSKGFYEGTENAREGLVFRLEKFWDTPGLRASFKVINNEFLLKKK